MMYLIKKHFWLIVCVAEIAFGVIMVIHTIYDGVK